MKQLTSYNRAAGYLNKIFDMLNEEFFESALSRPTITIQSTPKAYGHFSLREDTWVSKLGSTHEINIGAGTLARPIEEVGKVVSQAMRGYGFIDSGTQKVMLPKLLNQIRNGFIRFAVRVTHPCHRSRRRATLHISPFRRLLSVPVPPTMPCSGGRHSRGLQTGRKL